MSASIWLWKGIFNKDTPFCVSTTCYILITWEGKGNYGVWNGIEEGDFSLVNIKICSANENNDIIGFSYTFHLTPLMNILYVSVAFDQHGCQLHLGAWKGFL